MLGHTPASRSQYKHRGGRNIEGVQPVAPGADDVDQMAAVGDIHGRRKLAHDGSRSRDFRHRFNLGAQAHQQRRRLHMGEFARHDLPHQVQHFVVEQFVAVDQTVQCGLHGNHGGVFQANSLRKLSSMA